MTDQTKRDNDIQNPELSEKMEWIKQRLGVESNEELFSKALTLLYQSIELEDKGYKIGAFTEPGPLGEREYIVYNIVPKSSL
ncbi:hypothetical protein HQN89_23265 [Paenibacillus frigoriresistens]|uniref:hypothetical protein n=1 Tax=Paenibacillus alginolyticus TaxID=59839 RepID=UPI001566B5D0|nr:hypothetical protein [Paenibacillus frigoriresistens]NRF93862.1 hypothetical protein [Paenibacillus frigoriresistens]